MSDSVRFAPIALIGGAVLLGSSLFAAALAYDDVPEPDVVVVPPDASGPVYGYAPARPGVRVYGYGPVYRADPEPSAGRDRQPLGTYAPNESENLSPPRAYFRGVERSSGGS